MQRATRPAREPAIALNLTIRRDLMLIVAGAPTGLIVGLSGVGDARVAEVQPDPFRRNRLSENGHRRGGDSDRARWVSGGIRTRNSPL